MEYLQMLKTLCNARGISGREDNAAKTAVGLLSSLGDCESTPLGGVLCRIHPAQNGGAHLLLTAHLDQIGMMVTFIEESGFLRMGNVGGVDRRILPAARLTVHTASGPLTGVVCTVPPHLQGDEKKSVPQITELALDVGLSGEAARQLVQLGDPITFAETALPLLHGKMTSPALDDRAGCVCVLESARRLAEEQLSCGLSVLLSSMEEVGGQGAMVGTKALRPTHALAVDVSFAMQPGAVPHKCGVMGDGVMIGISPLLNREMYTQMKAIAQREDIPFQMEIMGGKTGTDADHIAVSGHGVKTALLSVPLRNMHTAAEVVWEKDIDATIRLMTAWVKETFGGDN